MTLSRVIFHIDVNSAFLSWTAVKIVREGGQDIRLVPSVVSGDPGDRRSIIAAASMPAKKLGIRAAMPVTMARRACAPPVLVHGRRGGAGVRHIGQIRSLYRPYREGGFRQAGIHQTDRKSVV